MAEAFESEKWEKAKELYCAGKSYKEVSAVTGIAESTLRKEGAKMNWSGQRNRVGTEKGEGEPKNGKKNEISTAKWVKIKNEYVTTEIAQRGLAKKYKLAFSTVAKKCKEENWVEERSKWRARTGRRLAKKAEDLAVERLERVYGTADRLLARIDERIDDEETENKDLSGFAKALVNIKEVQDLVSSAIETADNSIKVIIEGDYDGD